MLTECRQAAAQALRQVLAAPVECLKCNSGKLQLCFWVQVALENLVCLD
jgi:hypothetical protein